MQQAAQGRTFGWPASLLSEIVSISAKLEGWLDHHIKPSH